jgi:hypothetical protein
MACFPSLFPRPFLHLISTTDFTRKLTNSE